MAEDSDPVVASYNVFLNQPSPHDQQSDIDTRLVVLQYPAHRPSSRPYNAARSQKPHAFRLKPLTGLVEAEVPILTNENYNADAGARYGKALADSRTVQVGGSHGLAGGFNNNATHLSSPSLQNVPTQDDESPQVRRQLLTQTLGGKIAIPTERDPVYFLGSFQGGIMHLSHLDSVVQMRPQLHHIDAEDEINQKRLQMTSSAPGAKGKPGLEPLPLKLESKAIEIKMKEVKDDPRDRGLNEGARLLRNIQSDTWKSHDWIDQDDGESQVAKDALFNRQQTADMPDLLSSLSNGDWLDRMSAPREDGKKGLLAKLRGRERERARRKKAEEEKKRLKSKTTTTTPITSTGPLLEQSSDSDLSSPDPSDVEGATGDLVMDNTDVIEIKEEDEPAVTASSTATKATSQAVPARKTGRPRKNQQAATIYVDD